MEFQISHIVRIREEFDLPHLGILHFEEEGGCIGGAEYVPSVIVPYHIPRREDTAFLTCSYLSSSENDYRSHPLERLETELSHLGFEYLIAIASVDVAFPNGTLDWFVERGYIDQGKIYYEKRDGAEMHLVKKRL